MIAKIELTTEQKHHIAAAIDQLESNANLSSAEEIALNVLKSILPERLPTQTQALANYPNPFNAETWIPFALPRDGYVEMVVYDLSGHLVQKINLGQRPAGDYFTPDRTAYWNGRNIAGEATSSGTYFAVLSVDEQAYISQKMILQE